MALFVFRWFGAGSDGGFVRGQWWVCSWCGKGGGFVCGAGVRGVERAVDLFVARVSCGFSRLLIQLSVGFCVTFSF